MASYFSPSKASDIKLESSDFVAAALVAGKNPRITGWMKKQGQKNKMSWQRRYFVLDQNCLFYYASPNLKSVVGMIWVEGCTVLTPEPSSGDGGSPLRIVTVGSREYVLQCETDVQRASWISELKAAQLSHVRRTSTNPLLEAKALVGQRGSQAAAASETSDLEKACDAARTEAEALRGKLMASERAVEDERTLRQKEMTRLHEEAEARQKSEMEDIKAQFTAEMSTLQSQREAAAQAAGEKIKLLEAQLSVEAETRERQEQVAKQLEEHASARTQELEKELALTLEHARLEETTAAAAMDQLEFDNLKMEQEVSAARVEADILRRARGLHRRHPAGASAAAAVGAGGTEDKYLLLGGEDRGGDKPLRLWIGSWNLGWCVFVFV